MSGVSDFVLIVGYFDQAIRDYFGNGDQWNVRIEYATQRKQLGTADAVRAVRGLIEGDFLLLNGDAVIENQSLRRIISQDKNTMGLIELEDTSNMGVVEVNGNGVLRIHEKVQSPPTNLVNAGAYLFTPEIFEAIADTPLSSRGEYELTDSLQLLIDKGIPLAYERIDSWINITYPWDMLAANEQLLAGMQSQNQGEVEEGAVLKGPVSVGKGTLIRSGAYIEGPVIIGDDCQVGPNCYIRPATSIGDRCHIGACVEIKNSIIMCGAKVPHFNYVGDSVIGQNCNLGAGTKVANLKLDKSNVCVGGVDTGRRKLGAILGDGVQTGINSCLNVGCCIGNDAIVGPGMLANGVIRPRARIF